MAAPEIGPAAPAELDAVAALCQRGMPQVAEGYFAARLRREPDWLAGGVLVARADGGVVATVHALALTLRFGAADVPCGGIANVVTDPAHRSRGWSRRLIREAHRLFAGRGFPASLLFTGIHDFYRPLGYETWERRDTHVLRLNAPGPALPAGVRPVDPVRDLPALAVLHDAYDGRFIGPLRRSLRRWEAHYGWTPFHPREDPALSLAAVDGAGRPLAYVRGSIRAADAWATVLEFAAAPDAHRAVDDLAAAFAAAAYAGGARAIGVPAPCREFAARLATRADAAADGPVERLMLRIADLTGLLRALAPELEVRAAKAPDGALTAQAGESVAAVRLAGGRVLVGPADPALPLARLDPARWVEVLGGVRPFSEQPFARTSTVGDREVNLLDALFPRRDAVFWEADAF